MHLAGIKNSRHILRRLSVHFPFQSFIFSADFFSFCTVAVCTAAMPSPDNLLKQSPPAHLQSALPPCQVQKRSAIPIRAHSLRSALYIECRHARIYRSIAQLLLDAQKLVVFCHKYLSAFRITEHPVLKCFPYGFLLL